MRSSCDKLLGCDWCVGKRSDGMLWPGSKISWVTRTLDLISPRPYQHGICSDSTTLKYSTATPESSFTFSRSSASFADPLIESPNTTSDIFSLAAPFARDGVPSRDPVEKAAGG